MFCATHAANAQKQQSEFVAHEWGTFTSIAGNDGKAVSWYPWAVPADLPSFVEHFQARDFKVNLSGTIRMETPVLYFYSPRETEVSVHVSFSRGLITEWYPHAAKFTPSGPPPGQAKWAVLKTGETDGSVTWDSVAIRPGDEGALAQEVNESRYYAARRTASTPLSVAAPSGVQHEKFLFYRGVSSEASPVMARSLADGAVRVENVSGDTIAKIFRFERRGTQAGFRSVASVDNAATLEAPDLNGSVERTSEEVLAALMDQGLYPDEARAMVETWKDSWFEEGTRLLYIVSRTFVDRVLPLSISPAPSEVTRVFVGRLELVSPRTRMAIESALANGDEGGLAKYNRFLQPILGILADRETNPAVLTLIRDRLQRPYVALAAQAR
jgi:hypothetical protein